MNVVKKSFNEVVDTTEFKILDHKDFLLRTAERLKALKKEHINEIPQRTEQITKESCDFILTCPLQCLKHYTLIWFRAFISLKDECMLLFTGEILRKYHLKEHGEYLHLRTGTNWRNNFGTSACSVDGIQFEIERFKNRFHGKVCSFFMPSNIKKTSEMPIL